MELVADPYFSHLPNDEKCLHNLWHQLVEARSQLEAEDAQRLVTAGLDEIKHQLNRFHNPRPPLLALDTAAGVHIDRYYRARGLTKPSEAGLKAGAEKLIADNWKPTPGSLEWCSCDACIHNVEVLRKLTAF